MILLSPSLFTLVYFDSAMFLAQMGDKYNMVVKDLVKELRRVAMMKSCVSQ